MAGIGLHVNINVLDIERTKKKVKDEAKKIFRQAAQEWLTAVLLRIPVRTGFLAGAFTPMERVLGVINPTFSKTSIQKNLRKRASGLREYYKGILKTPTSGIPFASKPKLDFVGDVFEFEFKVNIIYLSINDQHPQIASAPWNSFPAGNAAFVTYLNRNITKVLDLKQYLTKQSIDYN